MDTSDIDVMCVGSATIDVFVLLNNLKHFSHDKFSNNISFPLGGKIPLDEYKLTLGGNGCNISVGLSRLGFNTCLAAEVGSDEFSEKIINTLKKEGVDLTYLKKEPEQTPYFNIALCFDGERTILEERRPHGLELEIGDVKSKFFYLTSLNTDWKKTYDKIFSANPDSSFALNPGSRQLSDSLDDFIAVLPKIEILFVNLQEAQKIAKDNAPDVKSILKKLKNLGTKIVVVTDGRSGSYTIDKAGEIYHLGIISPDKPIERTGAGDSYASGFMYGYFAGHNIKESMRLGAINADSVIKKIGSQDGLLTKAEIEQKTKQLPNAFAVKI